MDFVVSDASIPEQVYFDNREELFFLILSQGWLIFKIKESLRALPVQEESKCTFKKNSCIENMFDNTIN